MGYKLGDIFIGQFKLSQRFGADSDTYFARYKLKGHNGVDFACPTLTPILSAADGWISETGFDAGGYGHYIKVVHDGYFTIYAHLNDVLVRFKDKVVTGQIIGHSNNTGFSSAPHLHFGVAPCDINGIKLEAGNGYSGYIDPMGSRCDWVVKNLKEPVVPTLETKPDVPVQASKFVELVTKSSNWDIIAAYFRLTEIERIDPKAGEKIIQRIVEIEHDKETAQANVTPAPLPIDPSIVDVQAIGTAVASPSAQIPAEELEKTNILFMDFSTAFGKILSKLTRKNA